jgi:hypothetical protein
MPRHLVFVVICLLAVAQEVPIIDLTTVPVHQQTRAPTKGSVVGGIPGGKPSWPLQIELVSAREEPAVDSPVLICEVEVRNIGKIPVDLPVDPSPRDVEPADPSVKSFEFVSASIGLWLHPDTGTLKVDSINVYGAEFVSGTKRRLAPGSALRFRAKARISQTAETSALKDLRTPRTISAVFTMHRNVATPDLLETRQIMGPIESSNVVPVTVP